MVLNRQLLRNKNGKERKKINKNNKKQYEIKKKIIFYITTNILKISSPKTESFHIKMLIFFHISAQNTDCAYSLEPPHRGGSNKYTNPCFEQK